MYGPLLLLHSILRWLLLVAVVFVAAKGALAVAKKTAWTEREKKLPLFVMILADTQLLLGLLLYFVASPITQAAFQNMKATMKNPIYRFWTVEHLTMMLLAIVAVHLGKAKVKKATDEEAPRKARLWFSLAFVLFVFGIPWPFLPYGRGWF